MALKMDRDIRRVTVLKPSGGGAARSVYRRRDDDDDDDDYPIKRVTIVKRDDRGALVAHESYRGERKSKRQSRSVRPLERGLRDLLGFQSRVINNYLTQHQRSNEKRRDGWLSDMPRNVVRAVKKSKPKKLFRVRRLLRDRD